MREVRTWILLFELKINLINSVTDYTIDMLKVQQQS